MNENDKYFIKRYEELLNKGYCDCNEMNCIDNNSPKRILNIVNDLQSKRDKAIEYINKLKNFKIKYVMLEEKELYASEKDFVKDLLDILKEN